MRQFSLLLLVGLVFLVANCSNDNAQPADTGTLELNFQGTFGDEPLVMYARDYSYEAGMKMKLQLFRFYISELTLSDNYKLSDIEIVDFEKVQNDVASQQGVTIRFQNVPAKNYTGINMGLGVMEKLNKTQPGDYAPGHPLSDNYWSWALGYVFTKIEGNADVNADGVFNDKLTFHIGGDSYYRNKDFSKNFTVKAGTTTTLNFEVDLHKVLVKTESNFLDFRKVTIDHTNNKEVATFISDNMVNAIELK